MRAGHVLWPVRHSSTACFGSSAMGTLMVGCPCVDHAAIPAYTAPLHSDLKQACPLLPSVAQYRAYSIYISDSAVIARRDGILKFMFRVADVRRTQVSCCPLVPSLCC